MTIANSVLEEKQNRVVEILATAIPIRQLLYGKVLGNSLLALAQIALYAVVGLVAVNVTGVAGDIGWILSASGWFIAFFVAGFAALASVWAVLGSLASRSEDLQSNTGPVIGVILVALFAGLFAEGTWLVAASYVPVISSVAMPIRMLGGDVPVWEPIVSLLVTVVAAYLLLRLGERIYQRSDAGRHRPDVAEGDEAGGLSPRAGARHRPRAARGAGLRAARRGARRGRRAVRGRACRRGGRVPLGCAERHRYWIQWLPVAEGEPREVVGWSRTRGGAPGWAPGWAPAWAPGRGSRWPRPRRSAPRARSRSRCWRAAGRRVPR
ncbi:ABC transporter permease [Georgenia sp. AZ-5]|uniref:ABC transporter permease n=1 Tax=Georgenia sp. AZ-5 TaxID=3367526 RepID=UPI0037546C09